jgi:hypothetical protein
MLRFFQLFVSSYLSPFATFPVELEAAMCQTILDAMVCGRAPDLSPLLGRFAQQLWPEFKRFAVVCERDLEAVSVK